MSLLLVLATRDNLEKSIKHSVDFEFAKQFLSSEFINELLRQSGNKGIRCWALTKETMGSGL